MQKNTYAKRRMTKWIYNTFYGKYKKHYHQIVLFFTFCIGIFLANSIFFSAHTYADTSLRITLEECSATTCQSIASENATHLVTPNLNAGESKKFAIVIVNPSQSEVQSVESWLQFDPNVLTISDLSATNSAFSLAAPGEFEVDSTTGSVKIGRAAPGAPAVQQKIVVAEFTVTAKKNTEGTQISFLDFRNSGMGKTAVVSNQNMEPVNILWTEPKKLLFSSSGTSALPSSTPSPTYSPSYSPSTQIPSFVSIARPEGLRSRTYNNGQVDHIWKMGDDSRIKGYYMYYSTASGKYMHRKDVAKTNVYRFPVDFFEKGKRIYFAVQAYDENGKTSDFSDETYITVGTEGSESHPFFEQIFPTVQLDANGKAYRDEDGNILQAPTNPNYQMATQNIYTQPVNVNAPKPNRNTDSGSPSLLIFLIMGIAIIALGIIAIKRGKKIHHRQVELVPYQSYQHDKYDHNTPYNKPIESLNPREQREMIIKKQQREELLQKLHNQ
jgi:hypothetical protein